MVLLTVVVVLGVLSTMRFQATGWPRFLTPALHRNLSLLTIAFLGLHVVTAVVDPFTHLGWLTAVIPFSSYYRTIWLGLGTIAFELFAAVIVTSLVRGIIGQGAWRAIHWLAYASWPVAIVHGLGTGTDTWSAWLLVITIMCVAAVALAVGYRLLGGTPDALRPARNAFRAASQRRAEP
jgi:methionine sulfoxide reductase heme-binding subunit